MPTATKFESEEMDNGFPFCPDIVDVSGYDYWTTLSGVNKDNVGGFSGAQLEVKIQESLILAMKLYWNGYSIDAEAEAKFSNSTVNYDSTADKADVLGSTYNKPSNRVCGSATGYNGGSSSGSGSVFADISLYFNNPVRIFNSGVFVGYASGGLVLNMRGFVFSSASVRLLLSNYEELAQVDSSNEKFDYAYVELNGISFLCSVSARRTIASATLTVDAANLTTESNFVGSSTRIAKCSVSAINPFGFYTY